MKYKGAYSDSVTYSVGDVVVFTDGLPYCLQETAVAGTKPHDSLYWNRIVGNIGSCVTLFHSMISDILSNAAETDNKADTALGVVNEMLFDEKTIMLHSSTEDSTKVFAITVEDDGTIDATEVTDEGGEG